MILRKAFICLLTCILFLIFGVYSFAQDFEKHFFTKHEEHMPYLLLKPISIESNTNYPLIIYLHGAGSRGKDFNTITHIKSLLLADSNRISYPAFVVSPQCDTGYRWVETDWTLLSHSLPQKPSKYMSLLIDLLDSLEATYPIDKSRIYITGLSMGGFGTWDLIARFPDRFAAAAPICGGADLKTAEKIAQIPIWTFHGSNDRLVKVSRSREMVDKLKKYNSIIRYTEYEGVGHGSWIPAYKEPDFLEWMFSQKLNKK